MPSGARHLRVILLAALLITAACGVASAREPQHYVFYGFDRERITEPAFVATPALVGAQLKYRWSELEPRRGHYDFSAIRHDLAILDRQGKRLFIQVQDVSFFEARKNVPRYVLEEPEFHGGVVAQYSHPRGDTTRLVFDEWVPRRWDPAVGARLAALYQALGAEFDGKVAGVNTAETSLDFESMARPPEGFTPGRYYDATRRLMRAARAAFRRSDVVIYANFMPGESLPDDDRGYLKGVYRLADSLGMGVGGPDLLPKRWYQR